MRTSSTEGKATNKYHIKEGYRTNTVTVTQDEVSGGTYWDSERLKLSLTYQYPVYMRAKRLIRERGIRRVIDIGCGVASKLELLYRSFPRVEYIGIDQPAAIRFCREHHRFGRWVSDNLEDPVNSLEGLRADLVICADVIEHLNDPDVLLNYFKQRLEPDGVIVLSTPERDMLRGHRSDFSPNPYHVREWNSRELAAYLQEAGFRILEHALQLPVRVEFSRAFYVNVVKRALAGKPLRWNQVVILGTQ